jgi:hypothetical protein
MKYTVIRGTLVYLFLIFVAGYGRTAGPISVFDGSSDADPAKELFLGVAATIEYN